MWPDITPCPHRACVLHTIMLLLLSSLAYLLTLLLACILSSYSVFVLLKLMRHFEVHVLRLVSIKFDVPLLSPVVIESAACCSFSVASSTSVPTARMAVSSAKFATVVPTGWGMSLVWIRYRTGPSTLPCRTPALTGLRSEYSSPCLTLK